MGAHNWGGGGAVWEGLLALGKTAAPIRGSLEAHGCELLLDGRDLVGGVQIIGRVFHRKMCELTLDFYSLHFKTLSASLIIPILKLFS